MSNQIYNNKLYNEKQKRRYLDLQVSAEMEATMLRIFTRSAPLEEQFQSDLYNFTLEQIERLLFYLEPKTLNASMSNYYNVRNYIRWGIEQDLRDNNLNPLDLLGGAEYCKKFVDPNRKTLFRKDEIDDIVSKCVNAQDAVIVQLIFEGVMGTRDFDELLNLKKDSIMPNNGLMLQDGDTKRYFQVSDRCISLVERALSEETYLKKNGEAKETLRSGADAKLVQNDYVLRNVLTRSVHNEKASPFLVRRRLANIKEYFGLKVFTAYVIRNSGMLWFAKQLYDRYGKLGKEQYEEICERFNITKTHSMGYEVYNYSRYKDDFLNIETIKEIYGES